MLNRRCRICQAKFHAKPWHIKRGWARFCSLRCKNEGQKNGRYVSCATCNKKIYREQNELKRVTKTKRFFCNKSCFAIWKNKNFFIGAAHSRWKDGASSYRKILMRNKKTPECQSCGLKDFRALLVHHVDRNRKHNQLRNLRWLCHNCHYLEHEGKTI